MQALAKEHSQYGVHGVNIIANGSIRDEDTKETRAGQRMSAESVAETYLWLANQSPTLWTHEVSRGKDGREEEVCLVVAFQSIS